MTESLSLLPGAALPQPQPEPSPRIPVAGEPDVDIAGMWYRARLRHGIDDPMWFAFYRQGRSRPEWHCLPHRDYDGLGALSLLLAQRYGHDPRPLPETKERRPSLWRMLSARRPANLPVAQLRWRALNVARADEAPAPPVSCLLSEAESQALEASAKQAGVSSTMWLFWTVDRAARELLVAPDSVVPWLLPVSLRGAIRFPRWSMNHCSGLTVTLAAASTPADLRQQVRDRFASLEHWRTWLLLMLGRWVGQRGINLLYRLGRTPPGHYAGSYSNLGEWNVPGIDGLSCAAPGSPGYPIAVGTLSVRGRHGLGCRLHPVIARRPELAEEFLQRWRQLATQAWAPTGAGPSA